MDTLKNMDRKWLGGFLFLVLLLAIPLTMYLVRQQQILKSRATGSGEVSFALNPATSTQPIDQDFTVTVKLRAGTNDVSSVDLHLLADSTKVKFLAFTPSSSYASVINPQVADDKVDYVGVNPTSDPRRGDVDIGTLRLRLLSGAAATGGTVTIDPATTRVTVAGTEDLVITTGNTNGQYGPVTPPSPSLAPGQPFITDISFNSSLPSCLSSALTSDQLAKVTISWQGQAFSNNFWVEISPDSNFAGTNYYHKAVAANAAVTTFNTDLTNFNHLVITGTAGRFAPLPGQNYFVRVFNGQANAGGIPIGNSGIYSPLRSFSTSVCPSPSPSPSPVAALSCSDVSPNGLTEVSGQTGSAGEKIFSSPYTGGNVRLNVTRTPINASVNPTATRTSGAGDITFTPLTGQNPNNDKVAHIPDNSSTSAENVYRIDTNVGSAPQTAVSCPSVIVKVDKKPLLAACNYQGTEVRLQGPGDVAWVRNRRLKVGEKVTIAGFHNVGGVWGYRTNSPASDVIITIHDPDGQEYDINATSSNGVISVAPQKDFTPTKVGRYRFSGITNGMERGTGTPAPCADDSANLDVEGFTPTTVSIRVAESEAGLRTAPDIAYTDHPLTLPYSFVNKTLGDHQIWVKFIGTDANGQPTEKTAGPFPITIISANPSIDGVDCDSTLEGGVRFTIRGSNFGSQQGRRGSVKSGQSALHVDSWSDTQVLATLNQAGTVGQGFLVKLVRDDQAQSDDTSCSISTSQIQVGTRLFCGTDSGLGVSNVELTIAEARDGGTVATETVTIDSKGLIKATNKLNEGKPYRIGIKTPRSLRRVFEVKKASRGTTKIGPVELPVGDVFPILGDGKINSADYGELVREWVVAQAATSEKRADLNGDGRVNSFDWACMRPFFNQSDDGIPTAFPLESLASPSPSPAVVSIPVSTSSANISSQSANQSTGSGTVSP